MTLTIQDVAKLANVSTATVSRVLANHNNVTQKTRERVLEVIHHLEYRPNRLASNLRKKTSQTIAVIVPDITNPFFSEILKGIRDEASKNEYHVLLFDTNNSINIEKEIVDLVRDKLVDGIILTTAKMSSNEIYELSQQIPLVLACEYIESHEIPTVSIDNVTAAREATEYLIHQGHQKIGFISGPFEGILCRDRIKGYQQALLLHDIPVHEFYLQEGDYSIKSGYDITMKYLAGDQKLTAIVTANDEMAVGVMKACKHKGLHIPDDMSIIGFDDIPLCTFVDPEITTVHQPKFEMGCQAMKMLLNIIEKVELKQKRMILPHQLMVRQTTLSGK